MGELTTTEDLITVRDARTFFEKRVLPNSPKSQRATQRGKPLTMEEVMSGQEDELLYKRPLWDSAFYKVGGGDTALVVPIRFELIGFRLTGPSEGVYLNRVNYLFIQKDENENLNAEWITYYPDSLWLYGKRDFYIGKIKVSDWDGNILRGYSYDEQGNERLVTAGNGAHLAATMNKANPTGTGRPQTVMEGKYKDIFGDCWEDNKQEATSDGLVLYRKKVDCDTPPEVKPVLPGAGMPAPSPGTGGIPVPGTGEVFNPGPCTNDPVEENPGSGGVHTLPKCMVPIKVEPVPVPIPDPFALDKEPKEYKWRNKLTGDRLNDQKYLEETTPREITDPVTGAKVNNPEAFNCHFYAFGTDYAASIDPDHPKWVINISLPETDWKTVNSDVKVGDRIIYMTIYNDHYGMTHSGIVTEVEMGFASKISSKMGTFQIIEHHPRDVPETFGSTNSNFEYGGKTYRSRIYVRKTK